MPRVTDVQIRSALRSNPCIGEVALDLDVPIRRVAHVQRMHTHTPDQPMRKPRHHFIPESIARHQKLISPQGAYWAEMEGVHPLPRLLQGELRMPKPRKPRHSEFNFEEIQNGGDAA